MNEGTLSKDHTAPNRVALLWHVLPETAARPSEPPFEASERRDSLLTNKGRAEFCDCVSNRIAHNGLAHRYGYKDDSPEPRPAAG